MADEKPIGFRIADVKIEQFATVPGVTTEGDDFALEIETTFFTLAEKKILGNRMDIRFTQDDQPFVLLTLESHFAIQPDTWPNLLTEDQQAYRIPLELARHLSVISVGTARGVLLAKLRNKPNPYAAYVLPTVDLTQVLKEDVIIGVGETI